MSVFDYYAVMGGGNKVASNEKVDAVGAMNFTCISQTGFRLFCEESDIARPRSRHCSSEHLDQLFVAVNNLLKGGELEEPGVRCYPTLTRTQTPEPKPSSRVAS